MIHYLVVFAFGFTVLCRATHMDHETHLRVRLQYWIPLALSFASLPIFGFSAYSSELLGTALCAFLWTERRAPRCKMAAD